MQGSALSHWLVGVDVEQGPDGIDSPTFLKQNFDVLEAVHLYQEAQLGPFEDLFVVNSPYPEGINQLALRISTYEYPLGALLAIYFLSATGHMPSKFPLDHWIKAVQWHGDSKVAAFVNTEDEWADAQTLLTPLENIVVEAELKQGAVVWSSTQKDHPAIQRRMPLPSTLSLSSFPPSIEDKVGRLVGVTELEKGPASKTRLDVPPAFRNDVLRGKQVMEVASTRNARSHTVQLPSGWGRWTLPLMMRASSMGTWMSPQDHKQTPGGLHKSEEARAFRRKLMRRPIALRGDTKFIPPHMLGAI